MDRHKFGRLCLQRNGKVMMHIRFAAYSPGSKAPLKVLRDRRELSFDVTVGELKDESPAEETHPAAAIVSDKIDPVNWMTPRYLLELRKPISRAQSMTSTLTPPASM